MKTTTRLVLCRSLFPLLTAALWGCGQPPPPAASLLAPLSQAAPDSPALADDDGDEPAARAGCERPPRRGTRPRKVVVSHPYDASGDRASVYEVLDLSAGGKLTTTATTFSMGRLSFGRIVFTPDGQVGLAAQEDGSIGVFRFDHAGAVHVVHTAFTGVTYATGLVMDPSGERVYVLNNEWRESGGGIYSARIGCDGTLTSEGLLAASKLPAGLVLLPPPHGDRPTRAVLAAVDVLTSAKGYNAHLLGWPKKPTAPALLAGVDGFGDAESIISAVARTADARYVLIGDNSEFSGIDNRIAVVAVEGDALRAAQLLTPVQDPIAIVLSPYNNAGLVVSGYGNAVFHLSYDPTSAATPFVDDGEIPYVGKRPQLPSGADLIEQGRLRGRVFVAELEGVRMLAFGTDGTLKDLGLTSLGDGLENIVGALGVQP